MTEEQQAAFLLNAKVIRAVRYTDTRYNFALNDGKLTQVAVFDSDDQPAPSESRTLHTWICMWPPNYHTNLAAYHLAKLLGLDDMVPVCVERQWNGMTGSMCWRVNDVAMTEGDRGIPVPDVDAWNKQIYRVRVFAQLIGDEPNPVITKDWRLWLRGFLGAFRPDPRLHNPGLLVKCDRDLYRRLTELGESQILDAIGNDLSADQTRTLIVRWKKIAEHFKTEIAAKGEDQVLY